MTRGRLWLDDGAWHDPRCGDRSWWHSAITAVRVGAPVLVDRSIGEPLRGASRCVEVVGTDNHRYFLKSTRTEPRALVSEQVVARIGRVLGAPVPDVIVLDWKVGYVPVRMRAVHTHGLAHGSRKVGGLVEELGSKVDYADVGSNRERYLRLALLYGLMDADDVQFIAECAQGQRVWSVDHGMFLRARLPSEWGDGEQRSLATLHPHIAEACRFTLDEIAMAATTLARLRPVHVIDAIGAIPRAWFTDEDEPARLALYLAKRRDILASRLRMQSTEALPS